VKKLEMIKHATIKDLAQALGISKSTVSRALADHSDVKPETKRLVLEMAEKMNYRPNPYAQNLIRRRSKVIGVVVPEFVNSFFPRIIIQIQKVFEKEGFNVLITQSGESAEIELKNLHLLENSMVVDVTTTVEPTNHVVKTYGAGAPVSPLTGTDGTTNAPASYSRVLTGKATGYYSKSGKGSSGLGLGYGTVAVDPDVIPYGTLLYITSTDGRFVYGYAIATDTGIAVQKGEILVDLFYETYAESVINGAIQVNVYVVN
jgi:3D (Asp-Asp-Asp) domain-containing protein/transcriptional regulator with XRE-family HTH domain